MIYKNSQNVFFPFIFQFLEADHVVCFMFYFHFAINGIESNTLELIDNLSQGISSDEFSGHVADMVFTQTRNT